MPFDREDALKKAEKLLRLGRLEAAILEYVRVVEDQPGDWNTINTLSDLYVRVGQLDRAVAQYKRIADHFRDDGFYPKAAALYKKLLKLNPQDEESQLNLADVSQKQGLLADAKAHLNAVAARRRQRGDQAGAAALVVQLGSIDPADFDARRAAARTLADRGDSEAASSRFRGLYDDLAVKGRMEEAREALLLAEQLNPRSADVLTALLEVEAKAGRVDRVRDLAARLADLGREHSQNALRAAGACLDTNREAACLVVESVADALSERHEYRAAAGMLQQFISHVPDHVPPLVRLIEVCLEGGLDPAMVDAQARLADAYLAAGRAAEARVIAEDLVAREPWERAHIDRFRRALVMLKVPEPDTVIADLLSGDAPFISMNPFPDVPFTESDELRDAPPEPGDLGVVSDDRPGHSHFASTAESARDRVEQVFERVRADALGTTAADDALQLMMLARKYLKMGVADEAVAPLEAASRSPRFQFEAGAVLGSIYRDRGDAGRAIQWFERAAEAVPPDIEEGRALLYDLGALLETAGETSRALAVFIELQTDAGEYRDAAVRIERLARVETGG